MSISRWLNKSPNLGNAPHKQGEVTLNRWAETHIVSGMPGLETICAAIMTYLYQKDGYIQLSNTTPQYMYSSNIIDTSRISLPRFVTQIFVAGKSMLLSAVTCVLIRWYWFTTDFLLLTASPLRFLIACYHDMTVTLMCNIIQSQRGQKSILVFQWRLTSENVNA